MKTFFFALLMTFTAASNLLACEQLDVQIGGTVKNFQKVKIDNGLYDCYYEVELLSVKHQNDCALDERNLENLRIEDSTCTLKNGMLVSGYAKLNLHTNTLEVQMTRHYP